MHDNADYWKFLYERFEELIRLFNYKFNLQIRILPLEAGFPNENIKEFWPDDDNPIRYKVLMGENTVFYLGFRYLVKKGLSQKINERYFDKPIMIFSTNRFVIQYGKEATPYDISQFESIVTRIIRHLPKNADDAHKVVIEILVNELAKRFQRDFSGLNKEVFFDETTISFRFSDYFTNKFFNQILENQTESVCRYTSQNSIFSTLSNESQRMFGVAGMNDIEEIDYTDRYLSDGRYIFPSTSRFNDRFILSCTSMDLFDDLTMYRLYANDGKGVCLEYLIKMDPNILDFYIKKVEYADKNGRNPILENIKGIITAIEKKTGFYFDFFGNSGWKFFFKSKDYAFEKEVRLLFFHSNPLASVGPKKWVITDANGIINPFMEFSFDPQTTFFPLELKTILIGPKHPEKKLNFKQYEDLISCHMSCFPNTVVQISTIENYR